MEENKENIRAILKQASQHPAPSDMAERVLKSWKVEQVELKAVRPLISRPIWFMIGTAFVGILLWIISQTTISAPQTRLGDLLHGLDLQFSSVMIQMQPVMLLSIIALAMAIGVNVLIINGKWKTGHLSLF